ncbi:MAG TPA: hypothetical protein VIQ30_16255 [Pseudonocardia sp.]
MSLPPIPASIRRCSQWHPDHLWLYAYWDRDGVLLYVGIGTNALARAQHHRRSARWWRFVATGHAWLHLDADAEQSEFDLIVNCKPLFNITHARGSGRPTLEYCARREAWDQVDGLLDIMSFGDGMDAWIVRESLALTR